jgi:YD repeat-containing protein
LLFPAFNPLHPSSLPLLATTTHTYDLRGNLISVTDPLGNTTQIEYNTLNLPTRTTDPEGRTLTRTYDSFGPLLSETDGVGNTTTTTYSADPSDRLPETITSPSGAVRTLLYDIMDRTISDTLTTGGQPLTTTTTYDARGQITSVTTSGGQTTTYAYDPLGRLIQETMGAANVPPTSVTTYTYDSRGNLLTTTDAKGNTWSWSYDLLNRQLTETMPPAGPESVEGATASSTYDLAGNLLTHTDPQNQTTEQTFDPAGRLIQRKIHRADGTLEKTITFTLDERGLLLATSQPEVSYSYAYDLTGRKIGETADFGPFHKTQSTTYLKNGLKASFTTPDGTTQTYTYDAANRLQSINLPGQGALTWSQHTPGGQPGRFTLPGGHRID